MQADRNIPVTILTGFLGSGKTTLLNRLLADPALADTAVIVNEFGEVGIDHLLVEQADEGIIELSDGCLCCSVRGDLIDTLSNLIDRLQTGPISRLAHVVIETTGLADPAPILQVLIAHPILQQSFRVDGVVTTVDAVNGINTLDNYQEAIRQVAVADRIVLTKTDIADNETTEQLKIRLMALNPAAEIISAQSASLDATALLDCGVFNLDNKIPDVRRWLAADAFDSKHHHDHHHDSNRHSATIRAFSLTHDKPISSGAINAFIDLLSATKGEKILRMKGVIETVEKGDRPLVIHGVQGLFHPPMRLKSWNGDKRETRLVIIADGLDQDEIQRLFDAFLNRPAIDTADREALTDNPLVIPGFKF